MKDQETAEDRIKNFAQIWSEKPMMIMGNNSNHLASARAFLFGVKWAASFQEPQFEYFRRFLESFDRRLSKHLSGSDDGVSWFDTLLERHNGDEDLAFQEFAELFQHIAKQEGFIAQNSGF